MQGDEESKGIRHKAQGTRGKTPFIISLSHAPWALRPNYTPQGGAIEGNAADEALLAIRGLE